MENEEQKRQVGNQDRRPQWIGKQDSDPQIGEKVMAPPMPHAGGSLVDK